MRAVSSRVSAIPWQHARWRLTAIVVAVSLGASALVPLPAFAQTANQPPVAEDDEYSVDAGAPTDLDVLWNDSDPDGDPLTITAVTGPSNGSTMLAGDVITYTPNAGFTGDDSFTYTISDGNDHSDTATVTVTVEAPSADPVAADDTATTPMDAAITIDVLANDTPSDAANALAVTSATTPSSGSVVVNADDTITYTPDAGFSGTDTFDYTVSEDGAGTATATVTVTVQSSSGNGNGNGCADGEWVDLGFNGLGFCIAHPNPDWTGDGQQIFPDGLFPGGLLPHGLFPDGVFGRAGGDPTAGSGDPLESVASPAPPSMPDGHSLAEDIIAGVHASLGW